MQKTSNATCVAHTPRGALRGFREDVDVYRGIPYAMPPVGPLRWAPPRPHAGWAGIRDALAFGPDCVQTPHPHLRGCGMSEDCLYLNVWTGARSPEERRPVMVWIHGDGYTRGSGSHAIYDGQALARRGVVLVTLNYRLGLPGFLAHAGLSAESPHGSSGNYGLLDQIEALRWVRENIAAFGGDPDRVTVFGQSAGASCTHLLMACPLAAGLFSQAILHSPGAMRPMATLTEAEASGERIGSDIAAMRDLPAHKLLEMTSLLVPARRKLASPRGLGPIVDGWIVQGDDVDNYRRGRVRPMPLVTGIAANEGKRLSDRFAIRSVAQLEAYLADSFGSLDALPRNYRATQDEDVVPALERVIGDTQFSYGTWRVAQSMRELGAPVYQYVFARPNDGADHLPTHDDELPYVFGTLAQGGLRFVGDPARPPSPAARSLGEQMMAAWVRFAATGNPNGDDLPHWPRLGADGAVLYFDDRISLGAMPRVDDLLFIRDLHLESPGDMPSGRTRHTTG
ncbi:carboxylesterase family protein [Verticiella sediminum]|uniref:Carboxylic ester hydrolase n=1 Tax=Verticiella sediminum TaxID=1247510 RepID=A0A556AYU6_9BURK|nr:carboxylesterase family protein [Verticiella sediminum]TSH97605.1 carboxylesterase family protein [Verticiella sediminum]